MTGHILDDATLQELAATAASEYVIEARDVWKRYGANDVLQGISLGVHRGDVKAILGPSGSGKSTLLRCLVPAGADRPRRGPPGKQRASASANAAVAWSRCRSGCWRTSAPKIGMVFQRFNLFPHLTALRNVMIGLTEVLNMPDTKAPRAARQHDAGTGGAGPSGRPFYPLRAVRWPAAARGHRPRAGDASEGDALR